MKKESGIIRNYPISLTVALAGLAASALAFYDKFGPSPGEVAAQEFFSQRPAAVVVAEPENAADAAKPLRVYRGFEDPNYSVWDEEIIDSVTFWNKQYEKYRDLPNWEPLDPELFKCLCLYECRNGNTKAFRHNPAQFGNEGDPGFIVMRDGGEDGIPEGGYRELHGYEPIPPKFKEVKGKNGKIKRIFAGWDFEAEGIITPELAIKYAPGWLWHKNCIRKNLIFEDGPVKTYTVRRGDNLSTIEKRLETTVSTIQKYTPTIRDKDMIHPDQEISYRKAHKESVVSAFRGWTGVGGMIEGYNGGGDPNYLNDVLEIYKNPTN